MKKSKNWKCLNTWNCVENLEILASSPSWFASLWNWLFEDTGSTDNSLLLLPNCNSPTFEFWLSGPTNRLSLLLFTSIDCCCCCWNRIGSGGVWTLGKAKDGDRVSLRWRVWLTFLDMEKVEIYFGMFQLNCSLKYELPGNRNIVTKLNILWSSRDGYSTG